MVAPPEHARRYRHRHICGYPLFSRWDDCAQDYLLHDDDPNSPTYESGVDTCPRCDAPVSVEAGLIDRTLLRRKE